MELFREPSRDALPKPTREDLDHAIQTGAVSSIPVLGPFAAEFLKLIGSPVESRRVEWLEDLARRLRDLECVVEGFSWGNLVHDNAFISATVRAANAVAKTHEQEKLDALRNAVLNVAEGGQELPSEIQQQIFLEIVDNFTSLHLQVLKHLTNRAECPRPNAPPELTNQIIQDLNSRGLLIDGRPYVSRNRDFSDLLPCEWSVSPLGYKFLTFITAPDRSAE